MTDPGPSPEPTLADVLAAVHALASQQAASEARLTRRIDALEDRMIDRFAKAREDSAGIKLAVAGVESGERDTAEAVRRHLEGDDHHRHAA